MKLEIDSVQLIFDQRKILSDVYACFETGKIHGVLGRNGSGKSCFFKILFGTLKAEFATIRLDSVYKENLYKTLLIKYLPQNFVIPENFSISKAIDFMDADLRKCEAILIELKIDLNTTFENLSGGQRRLVEIIIFLNTKSPFLIFDEPFTHIMPVHIEKLQSLFLEYKETKSIIISDHQYRHLIAIADGVYLLKDGKMNLLKTSNLEAQLRDLNYLN